MMIFNYQNVIMRVITTNTFAPVKVNYSEMLQNKNSATDRWTMLVSSAVNTTYKNNPD